MSQNGAVVRVGYAEGAVLRIIDDQSLLTALRSGSDLPADFADARDELLHRRLAPLDTRLKAAVQGPVEITRDRAGVPHIFAASTADVYFGLGFAMAQDRLWQMDRLRRRALGRQAEILGSAYVQSDLEHLAVDIPAIAASEVERTDPATRLILDSFVSGINRHIESCGAALPIEFALLEYEPEPFTVRDVIAALRGMWWSLNGRLYSLAIGQAASLLPEHLRAAFLTPEAPENRILPADAPYPSATPTHDGALGSSDYRGSNNWAVAATRTKSGHALLCSDPHQPFWVPSSWYEYGLHGPEDDAAGADHPGVPGLWWGSNGTIAWGITNNAASTRDLYREQTHPTDARLYRDGQSWRSFDERTIEVQVRGQAPVSHVQRSTVRGPIVNHVVPIVDPDDQAPLALRWVGQEHLDDVRAVVGISRAQDWPTFRGGLRDWAVAVFNFGYADRSGRVGYQCAGRVPLRGRTVRGFRDANDAADEWQGYIPFDALPHVVDPPRGYVASANERVAPDDYPYALHGSFGSGYRAERIRQVIEAAPAQDHEQAVALQNDVHSVRAARLCPQLVDWLSASDDPDVVLLRGALEQWDYRYTLESTAPTLFETFMQLWQARVLRARFPERLLPLLQGQSGAAASLIEHADLDWFEGDVQAELIGAARDALDTVRTRHADWRWGAVHHAHWSHPLSPEFDIGPAPVDGGAETVRNTGAGQPAFAAAGGSEYRIVVDFAQPDQFLAVQNIGNSGQPGSPHYADQFAPWLAGEYHVVHLRRADVEREGRETTLLEP
jgi:penicillin amidase